MATHVKKHAENRAQIDQITSENLACRHDPEGWFTDSTTNTQAIAWCRECPARKPCLDLAMRIEEGTTYRFGIWGGYTARQRKTLARQRSEARHETTDRTRPGIPERIDAPTITAIAIHLRSGVNIKEARIAQHVEPGELRWRCLKRINSGESVRAKVALDDALLVLNALEDRARQSRATA